MHLVWTFDYRQRVLTGDVALRVRNVVGQIAMEHGLPIISGNPLCLDRWEEG